MDNEYSKAGTKFWRDFGPGIIIGAGGIILAIVLAWAIFW